MGQNVVTALERLQRQVDDLVVRYVEGEIDERPLMQQLLYLGPHIAPGLGVVRKIQPSSRPPGNLGAHQLHERIMHEAIQWAWTLGGAEIHVDLCLIRIPILVQQRVDTRDKTKTSILYGPTGAFAAAGNWHMSARILLGYERPADHYPDAVCTHCGRRGSIRGREMQAWCSNRDCRDEYGRRHEFDVEELAAQGADLTLGCAG